MISQTAANVKEEITMSKNFEMIRAAIESACAKYVQDVRRHMTEGEHADSVLERNSTATRWNQYTAGTIDRETAVNYAMKRVETQNAKSIAKKFARLDTYAAVADIVSIEIYVHWTRNRTWGYNPTATVYATDANNVTHKATGTASGCGYDKRSAAVCEALNQISGLCKMICAVKNDRMGADDAAAHVWNTSNANYIAYGAGYGAIPYFEGGCGIDSTLSTLKAIGFDIETRRQPDRGDDVYTLKRKADAFTAHYNAYIDAINAEMDADADDTAETMTA